MSNANSIRRFLRRGRARWLALAAILLLAAAAAFLPRGEKAATGGTFTARRGTLAISVLESGAVEAQESQEIRSEVKGWEGRKILTIVEEGYLVTEDDVRTNKVLVELDPSELRQRIITQDIEYQAKAATLTEAKEAYEIQAAQNRSELKAAEQKARFARLDLEKYLGDKAANEILAQTGLDKKQARLFAAIAAASTNGPPADPGPPPPPAPRPEGAATPGASGAPLPAGAVVADGVVLAPGASGTVLVSGAATGAAPAALPETPPASVPAASTPPTPPDPEDFPLSLNIDFSGYATPEQLGDGEAQQKLREAKDGLLLAEKEKKSSKAKLDGTERLFQKGFVTKVEFESGQLEYEQVDLKVKKAGTALTLFTKYEFPKLAEEWLSKYEEALRSLEKTRREASSKLMQARARRMSAEQQFRIVDENRRELFDQLGKCTIRAKKPGLVIYGGSQEGFYYGGEERIREGALVRERQPIITIPDLTRMCVKVRVHESHIKKVKKGMKARVRVESFADKQLVGEVVKVGVLPDSQNRWMNPDLKVYLTVVNIEGTHDWLKPGMTAKVEILVNELPDVVYVPLQAVTPLDLERVCHVVQAGRVERRVVEVGEYNDEFIEIKRGVAAGDQVLLRPPSAPPPTPGQPAGPKPADAKAPADAKSKSSTPPAPAAAPTSVTTAPDPKAV